MYWGMRSGRPGPADYASESFRSAKHQDKQGRGHRRTGNRRTIPSGFPASYERVQDAVTRDERSPRPVLAINGKSIITKHFQPVPKRGSAETAWSEILDECESPRHVDFRFCLLEFGRQYVVARILAYCDPSGGSRDHWIQLVAGSPINLGLMTHLERYHARFGSKAPDRRFLAQFSCLIKRVPRRSFNRVPIRAAC